MRLNLLPLSILLLGLSLVTPARGNDSALIDFQQHIQPLLENKCLKCHGPKEDKGGLRVDDLEALRGYIEPGDLEASSLWTDYLRTDDSEMIMPPADDTHAGGLPAGELLLIKEWILEGAEGEWLKAESDASESPAPVAVVPKSTAAKAWAFQGIFHPAAVHLPVALLAVSAVFVFLSFFNRQSCEPVAFHCLWIGALGAVAACLTGWAYAVHEGYGAGFSFNLEKNPIDRHRWLGIFVAVFSVAMIPLASKVRKSAEINQRIIWLLAGLILMGAVSVVGFQGGELAYGENHYVDYYNELFKSDKPAQPAEAPSTQTTSESEPVSADAPAATAPVESIESAVEPIAEKPAEPATPAMPTESAETPAVEPTATEPPAPAAASSEEPNDKPAPSAEPASTVEPSSEPSQSVPSAEEPSATEPSPPKPTVGN